MHLLAVKALGREESRKDREEKTEFGIRTLLFFGSGAV
jgi:hypothetical protein